MDSQVIRPEDNREQPLTEGELQVPYGEEPADKPEHSECVCLRNYYFVHEIILLLNNAKAITLEGGGEEENSSDNGKGDEREGREG